MANTKLITTHIDRGFGYQLTTTFELQTNAATVKVERTYRGEKKDVFVPLDALLQFAVDYIKEERKTHERQMSPRAFLGLRERPLVPGIQ